MNNLRRLSVLCVSAIPTLLFPSSLHAQTTERASMLAFGSANTLDTYLSPEQYKGTTLRLLSASSHHKTESHWTRRSLWDLQLCSTNNRANNSDCLGGLLAYQYSWLYNLRLSAINLLLGPSVDGSLGGLYNTRNGNNPAQLQSCADIGASAAVSKPFRLFKHDCRVNYQATLPLLGAAFSPQYGQSYYEIFTQGNYDHNAVLTSPFNALSFEHMLTIDVTLWNHTFRIGYLGDYRQREANQLKYHNYAHMLILGYVIGK